MVKRIVPTILAASIALFSGISATAAENTAISDSLKPAAVSYTETVKTAVATEITENGGKVVCTVDISDGGEYSIELSYSAGENIDSDAECLVLLDGKTCIENAVLKPYWQDSGSTRTDVFGDEYAPSR